MKKFCLILAIIISLPAMTSLKGDREHFASKLEGMIIKEGLYDFASLRFRHNGAIPSCRQEFYFALTLMATSVESDIRTGNEILAKYLACQVTNPDSPYYGSFYYPELLEKTEGIEWDMFNPIPILTMLNAMPERITKENRELAVKAMELVWKGLAQRWFPFHSKPEAIGHTNYHLMYCADMLLSAQYCGDRFGQALAMIAFENWVNWTKNNGVTEFNSPTYTAIDLQALDLIEKYSTNKRAQHLAKVMSDLIIADGVIHYKRPFPILYGANSRSYDVLTTDGKTCRYIEMSLTGRINAPLEVSAIMELFYEHKVEGWVNALISRTRNTQFEFKSHWGSYPWQVRKTWFGNHFVLGTSASTYGSQDRNLVIDAKDGRWDNSFVPVVAINDKPEELPHIGGGSGHNHLTVPTFTVADGPKALQLYDITYKEHDFDMNRLSLVLMFTNSTIMTADKNPDASTPFAVVTNQDLIMVRPFVSSNDCTVAMHQKDHLTIIEYRLVHDLRKDLRRRFFAGFAIEIAEDVYDAKATFEAWLAKPFTFKADTTKNLVSASFEGLKIDYDTKLSKPLNLPPGDYGVFETPWTCVEDDGINLSFAAKVRFKN